MLRVKQLHKILYQGLVTSVLWVKKQGKLPLSSAEVSMSFTWRLPYRTAVWKTRRRRWGKQEAEPLPEVGRKSAKLDEKVLELE
jgi:hypothetical protein